jgi:transposase-like protein
MSVTNVLIDSLLADYKKPEDLIGENGLLKLLTKKLVERALQAEMAEHLGHAKNDTDCQSCWKHPQRQEQENSQGRLRRASHRSPA